MLADSKCSSLSMMEACPLFNICLKDVSVGLPSIRLYSRVNYSVHSHMTLEFGIKIWVVNAKNRGWNLTG
jgi:hypothetical protein